MEVVVTPTVVLYGILQSTVTSTVLYMEVVVTLTGTRVPYIIHGSHEPHFVD